MTDIELFPYFLGVFQEDQSAVVLCNLDHEIIYMNPAAIKRYAGYGGADLIGRSLLDCHNETSVESIHKVLDWFQSDLAHNRVYTFFNEKENRDVYMIALRDSEGVLIGYYEKHEYRNRETMQRYDGIL